MAMDPVCHMNVDEKTAKWTSEFVGQTNYFCAPGCNASFDKEPEKYLNKTMKHEEHHHHWESAVLQDMFYHSAADIHAADRQLSCFSMRP